MGPGGPGKTHEDLGGLRWKNMVFVATVINMEARKVDLNMKP